jgi:hypothetical protein
MLEDAATLAARVLRIHRPLDFTSGGANPHSPAFGTP